MLISGFLVNVFCLDYKNITKYAEEKYLDPLTKDIGSILSGGYYHCAENLGIPGFDIGIRFPLKNINENNTIIKSEDNKVNVIGVPIVQAEVGLPLNLDLIARAMSYEGLSIFGGGIKYTIFKIKIPFDFSISGMAGYTTLTHDYIKANSTSGNIIVSVGTPIVQPYIGIGYDSTELTGGDKAKKENPILEDIKGKSNGTRIEAGANISPFPFIYLYGGYTLIYQDTGYTFGLGVKF